MNTKRGRSHTTLTETAETVVKLLRKQLGIKMVAPGLIDSRRSGPRHVTTVFTTAGFEMIISGQGVQKVAVHLIDKDSGERVLQTLKSHKTLKNFSWSERTKKPGI